LFEALTLMQTRRIANLPVVLLGTEYWLPVRELLEHLADQTRSSVPTSTCFF